MPNERPPGLSGAFSLLELVSLLVVYSTGVAVIYLATFWGSFGINIFPYIGPQDILVLAGYPLLFVSASTVLGVFLGQVLFDLILPARPTWIIWQSPRHRAAAFFVSLALLSLVVAFLFKIHTSPSRWFHILYLPFSLFFFVQEMPSLAGILPSNRARYIVAWILFSLPVGAFAIAKVSAERAHVGPGGMCVAAPSLGSSCSGSRVYLGKAGEFYFSLCSADRRVVIANLAAAGHIELVACQPAPQS